MVRTDRPEIELISGDTPIAGPPEPAEGRSERRDRRAPLVVLALVAGVIGGLMLAGGNGSPVPEPGMQTGGQGGGGERPPAGPESGPAVDRFDAIQVAQSLPRQLLAAELFNADPTADGLRELFSAIGGFEGIEVATAEGAFDLVRFDPADRSRLLAAHRLSYGEAQNQQRNEVWQITDAGEVTQALWAPSVQHDFVHYNIDGTVTMWVHGGGSGFAPRAAVTLGDDFTEMGTTEPLYASRFTATGGTVFALTGNGDYYSNERRYVDLIADDGSGTTVLDAGGRFAWIDNPTTDLLLAYPNPGEGVTAVWDANSLQPLPDHPLGGRDHQRSAVSADGTVGIGVTSTGELEIIDLSTGRITGDFGSVDVAVVDQPITLNARGTVAVTVENSGQVSIWWVGDDRPIASIAADQGQPRWLSSHYAATSASAVMPDASRIALRVGARSGTPTNWIILDSDPESWTRRACEQAGRALTNDEAETLGIADKPRACTA